MGVETASYIADLNTANPLATDGVDRGDDHLRLIKTVLQATFAGFAGPIIVTGTEAQGSTANDFVVTVSPTIAYQENMIVLCKATHSNTGAATLKVNSLTAYDLKDLDGNALTGGEIDSGSYFAAIYNSSGPKFALLSPNDRVSKNGDTIASLIVSGALTVAGLSTLASLAVSGTATGMTPAAGDNSAKFATTAFVAGLAISSLLPGQTGKDGLVITSISSAANWYEGVDQSRMALGIT